MSCKASGLVTEVNWRNWRDLDFRPYLDVVSEAFGPNRIMFGSDWLVCLLAAKYGNAALGDLEAQHQEFPVNARGPPSGILGYHFEDEYPDLFAHRPPTDSFTHAGDQPPIHLKTSTVPAHHGIGRHQDERRFPRRPETMKEDPEQLVGGVKPRAAALSLEHGYLLTQGEIFNQ